jgi:hypothetical protein
MHVDPDGLPDGEAPGQASKLNDDTQRQAIARMIESGPISARSTA